MFNKYNEIEKEEEKQRFVGYLKEIRIKSKLEGILSALEVNTQYEYDPESLEEAYEECKELLEELKQVVKVDITELYP